MFLLCKTLPYSEPNRQFVFLDFPFDLNYTEISLLLVLQYFAQEMLILSVHLQKEHNPSLDPIVLNIVETAPFPELIDRKKCGKMEWRQKIKGEKTMSNKKGSAPPRYDEEFKKGAMALVTEKGMPLKSAAKDLGICPDTLRSWLNASGCKPAEVAKQHRADSRQKELEAEIKKLRKQLAEKDEVIEILKKSVGILSQP